MTRKSTLAMLAFGGGLLSACAPAQTPDLVAAFECIVPETAQQGPTTEKIDDILTVEWHKKTIYARESKIAFSGGVVAMYGPTVLRADSLMVSQKPGDKRGVAEGNIRLEDPDGTITAEYLEFDWEKQTGQARNFTIAVEGLHLRAKNATLNPDEWVLTDVVASPDATAHPIFQMKTPRVVYRPGKRGTARRASIYAFGAKLITLPSYSFGSKRESQTMRLPSISFNRGLGISWQTALLADDRTRFDGAIHAKAGEGPGIGVQLTRSLLPRNEPEGIISPGSELNERFTYGYFDNIYVTRPSEERELITARRGSVAIGATLNQLAVGRLNLDLYSKPLEITFEQARDFGEFGFYSSLRFHDIREESGPTERRAQGQVTALLPQVNLGRGLRSHGRLDTTGYLGNHGKFGWAQMQLGVVYNPIPQLQIGAAWVRAGEFGKPTFQADRLFSLGGYMVRFDADLGSTRLSYLAKYDNLRRKWYDNEIALSQTFGSIVPFISYREFPRSFSFGVRLKAEETIQKIAERFRKRG